MSPKAGYPNLKAAATIGGLELRNRMIMAAMGSNLAETDGTCGERLQAYYEDKARGGVGLIILETTSVAWPAGSSMPNMVGFSEDRFLPGLTRLAERVHAHGARIAAQLNHSGKVSQEDTVAGRPLWVPSPVEKSPSDMLGVLTQKELGHFIKAAGPDGKGPRYHVMTLDDIETLKQQFVAAARRARQAGFDAIELHAGHGYVLSSFLSPAVNRREDQYGGTVENRARLLTETIAAVRAEVGADMPILVRLDAKEYRVEGGIQPADFVATAKLAEQAGADAIDVSAYGNPAKGIAFTEAPLVHKPAGFLDFARQAKAAVSVPVIAVGRLEPEVAEKAIAAGDIDFFGMGRKLLADPALPNKIMADKADQIRPCIYCYICVSQIFINRPLICAVNSRLGRESQPDLIASSGPTGRVLVIGGGPGGMEAAGLLAEQGNDVSLWEKEPDLGGTARIAALAYEPNGRLIRYLSQRLERLGVDVHLGKTATPETVRDGNFDHVIVATGAARRAPEIPGKELRHVFDGDQMRGLLLGSDTGAAKKLPLYQRLMLASARRLGMLRQIGLLRRLSHLWMPLRREIAIIGGGLVGLELAEFLVDRGRRVTVIEPGPDLGAELSIVRRSRVLHELRSHGVELIKQADVKKISEESVHIVSEDGSRSVPARQVIIALGASAELGLLEQLRSAGIEAQAVGDCKQVSYIDGAIHDARATVSALVQSPSADKAAGAQS